MTPTIEKFGLTDKFQRFRAAEDGAVTVDWVVLTATLMFLGIATAFFISSGVPVIAERMSTSMSTATILPD